MKKGISKFISVFLVIIMLIGSAPLSGFVETDWSEFKFDLPSIFSTEASAADATSGKCGNDVYWSLDKETGVLEISGSGNMDNYSPYALMDSYPPWFSSATVKIVVIGNNITSIGSNAFRGCSNLTDIEFGNTVKDIGNHAFYNCTSLENIKIPDSVISIGNHAFYNCSSLTSIEIPDCVTSIGTEAFSCCTNLTSISVSSNNKSYLSDSFGVLYNKNKTTLIQYPIGNSRAYFTIPNSVTSIASYAFGDCTSLTSVKIPDGVTSIGNSAFYYCTSLESIEIPDSVTSIGEEAFRDCKSLTSIEIPNGVTNIGRCTFYHCTSLTTIFIGSGVRSIGRYAFYDCTNLMNVHISDISTWCNISFFSNSFFDGLSVDNPLKYADHLYLNDDEIVDLTIPYGTKSISGYAFYGCKSLRSVTIPDSVTSIGDSAFYNCTNLESIIIGNMVTSIDDYAFYNCTNLESIIIGNMVTSIGYGAFQNCRSLTSVTIPDSVTSIASYAFEDCSSLTSVTIGNGVTNIGDRAFFPCYSLTSFFVRSKNKNYSSDSNGVLYNKDKTILIQYPTGNRRTSFIIPDSVTSIGDRAFYDCNSLTSVTIGNCVISIGKDAFEHCAITSVTLQDSVTSIGEWAFYDCKNLTDVYYSGSEEQWKKIKIGSCNNSLTAATIHYNYLPNKYSVLLITPRNIQSFASGSTGDDNLGFIKHEGEANWKLGNVSLKIGKKEYSQTASKAFVIPLSEITDDIVLSRSSYYDYIIPKEVAQSFYSSKEEYELNAWMSKDEHLGNKPYVSSVFAKVDGADTNFVDIRHEIVTVNEGEYCRFYISAGNVKGNTTYVISQDNSHKISKSTRSFSDNLASLSSTKSTVVYVKDKNGTSKAVSVKLSKEKANAFEKIYDVCKDGKFSLGGSDGLKLTLPKSWPLVGGASLNLLDFELPAGFEISADGTVRMSLGFDWTKKETESKYVVRDKKTGNEYYRTYSDGPKTSTNCDWENLKKDIKEVVSLSKINENKQKSKEAFEKTKKDVLKKSGIKSLEEARKETKGFDIGASALGFAEGKIVDGKIVFTDVQLSIGGNITISVTHQNTGWYVALEGGGTAKIAADWIREAADNDLPLQFDVTLSVEPYVKASGGVGAKGIISAGIYGKASLPVSLGFKNGHFMISLTGEIGAEAEVLFFKTGEISILSGTLGPFETYLWGKKSYMAVPKKIASAYNLNPFSDKNIDITGVTDRDNSKWVGSAAPRKLKASAAAAPKTVEVKNLQTDIYKESGVKTVTCGDTTMAVWTSDDGTRDAYNRLKLVYSLFDKETNLWSEPKAVYDDGYNDAMPEIATDGESIYVVWQKFMKKFTAENSKDVESVLGSGEIFLSKYDFENDEFTETARITNNSYYDYSPVVTVENGEPVVFYADSVNNRISETSGNNLNKYASNISTSVASDLSTVINIDCSTVNGNAEAAYSVDTDGNTETTDDISVFCGSDTFTEFDSEINTLTNIAYAPLDGENVLFVSDGINIYYKKNGEAVSVLENSVPVSEQIAAVCTSDGTSLFWASSTDAGNEIYSCSYSDGKWSNAVQLTSRNNMFTDLSFENVDGNIIGLANESVREYSEEAEAYKTVSTNLVMLRPQNFSDLAIDLAEIKTNNVEIGKEAAIYVTVSNNGNVPCEKLTFEITDNQGISNEYETEAHLLSGKSDVFILPYELTENLNKSEITVRVYDENYSDIASSDNTSVISDIKADMIPDNSKIEEFDDAYILSAILKNESVIYAENVCVKAVLNDENNEALTSVSFSNISSDSPQSVELVAPKDKLDYDENGNCIVYFVVTSDNNETITQSFVVSQNTTECEHRNTEIVGSIEPTCTEAGESGKLVCSDCGYVFEESVALESNGGHSFTDYKSDNNATCLADGTKTAKCDNCSVTDTVADEGSKLEHSYTGTVRANNNGTHSFKCINGCNEYGTPVNCSGGVATCTQKANCPYCKTEYGEALGHSFTNYVYNKDAKCGVDGTETAKCDRCTETDTRTAAGTALKHNYVAKQTSAPSCTVSGLMTYTCSLCKDSYTEDIDALKHDYKKTTTPATLTDNGKIETKCTVCGEESPANTIYHPDKFTLSSTSFTYTGKAIEPTVTVKDSKGKTVSSSNYTVSYSNNTNAGTGKVTIKFKGNYSGTKTVNFTITPKQVTGLKVSDEKTTSLKLSWSKTAGAKYYKVEQSTDGKKWKTVTTTENTSYTVKSLKAGTKYQFRVTALDSTKKIAGKTSSVLKTGTLTKAPALTLKSTKSKTATASWKKVTGAKKYVVYKSTNGKKWKKVTTTTKTAYTLKKLTGGKEIYVKVKAVNAYGKNSAYSSSKNVTVKK